MISMHVLNLLQFVLMHYFFFSLSHNISNICIQSLYSRGAWVWVIDFTGAVPNQVGFDGLVEGGGQVNRKEPSEFFALYVWDFGELGFDWGRSYDHPSPCLHKRRGIQIWYSEQMWPKLFWIPLKQGLHLEPKCTLSKDLADFSFIIWLLTTIYTKINSQIWWNSEKGSLFLENSSFWPATHSSHGHHKTPLFCFLLILTAYNGVFQWLQDLHVSRWNTQKMSLPESHVIIIHS